MTVKGFWVINCDLNFYMGGERDLGRSGAGSAVDTADTCDGGAGGEAVDEARDHGAERVILALQAALTAMQERGEKTPMRDLEIGRILSTVKKLADAVLECSSPLEFKPVEQVEPSPVAAKMMSELLKDEEKKIKERSAWAESLADKLVAVFSNEGGRAYFERFASGIYKRGVTVMDLISILKDDSYVTGTLGFTPRKVLDIFKSKDSSSAEGRDDVISDLRKILEDGGGLSKGFLRVFGEQVVNVDYARAWEEGVRPESSRGFFTALAEEANDIVSELFTSRFNFVGEVKRCNDVAGLQEMIRIPPVTPRDLELVIHANLKLDLIHALHLTRTHGDMDKDVAVSRQLARKLAGLTTEVGGGTIFNPPRTADGSPVADPGLVSRDASQEDGHHVLVDSICVDTNGKSLSSRLMKMLMEGYSDAKKVRDGVRFTIYLRREDSDFDFDSPEFQNGDDMKKLVSLITKILGILISVFRNNFDENRSVLTIRSGIANTMSAGRHRGLHVTFYYMNQSDTSFRTEDGARMPSSVPVECQILAYIPPDEREGDHDSYAKNRDQLLRKEMAVDYKHCDFALDLMEIVLRDTDLKVRKTGGKASGEDNVDSALMEYHRRNIGADGVAECIDGKRFLESGAVPLMGDNANIAVLLLEILTRRKADNPRHLENVETLKYLYNYHRAQLGRFIKKCSKWAGESLVPETIRQKAAFLRKVINSAVFVRGDNVDVGATPCVKLCRRKKDGNLLLAVKSCSNGESLERQQPYSGPVEVEKEFSNDGLEALFYEKFGAQERRLAYVISGDEDGKFLCYRVGRSDTDRLLIWELVPASDSGSERFSVSRKVHSLVYPAGDRAVPELRVSGEVNDGVMTIRPMAGNSILSVLSPSFGMSPENKVMYKAVEEFGGKEVCSGRKKGHKKK